MGLGRAISFDSQILPYVLRQQGLLCLLLLFLGAYLSVSNAQSNAWQQSLDIGSYDFARGMYPTPDGGYIAAGHTGSGPDLHQVFLLKLDAFGKEQWRRTYGGGQHDIIDDFRQTSDGGYLLVGTTFNTGGSGFDFWLTKTDRLGNLVWSNTYGTAAIEFARAAVETSDGGFAIVGRSDDGANVDMLVVKTDANGQEQWSDVYGGPNEDEAWGIAKTPDNQLVIVGQSSSFGAGGQDVYFAKITLDGSFQWFQTYGGTDDDFAFDVLPLPAGGYVVGGTTRSFGAGDYDVYLLKVDDGGILEWSQTYGGAFGEWGTYIAPMPDGGFALAGSTQSFNNWFDDIYLIRTDADGNLIWQNSYVRDRKDIPHSLALAPNGGFLIAAHSREDDVNGTVLNSHGTLWQIDAQGNLLTNYLQGRVYFDENNDCQPSPDETGFGGWYLAATRNAPGENTIFYGITDSDGNYEIRTDTGIYTLRLFPPNEYWEPCENDILIGFTSPFDTLSHIFPVQVGASCPQLEVDVATTHLKPCAPAIYEVKYCNIGTAAADLASMSVLLDSALAFVSSSLPVAGQSGLAYQFDLGTVGVGECGGFTVEAFLDCDAGLGATHLLTAEAAPKVFCLAPDPQWDNSSLTVKAECVGDSVRFTIGNQGMGGMSAPRYSIIVEDQIIGRTQQFQLVPSDSIEVMHPVNGKTLRLETEQTNGHPGRSMPSVSIETCGNSLGYITMFPQDDADAFRSIHGRESSANLEANDCLAFPKGIGPQHFIKQNTDIEYLFLFQNTGNDTVERVTILDTLSKWLNPTTVRQGVSSHPFTMTMDNVGVLEFTMENLQLLPASVNDSASVGFVKFRVGQVQDAPWDSLVVNRGSISFDYAQPIAQPQYFHTISKPQVLSISDVSLCTGGLYGGVAFQSDTTFFETIALPNADSLNYVNIDVGEFGFTVVYDTFTYLDAPINGWLLANDTTIVENFDLGGNCDSIVVWNVDVLTGTNDIAQNNALVVYPNPFENELYLYANQPIASLQMTDALGRELTVFSEFALKQPFLGVFKLPTDYLQPGIYFIFAKTVSETLSPVRLVKH